MIAQEKPEKIITLRGNCLVSQAPFDYLKGKYGNLLQKTLLTSMQW